jgi:hypothetical protein
LFVRGYEEPTLENDFGDEYREYRRNVRGWIPRLRPWHQPTAVGPADREVPGPQTAGSADPQ